MQAEPSVVLSFFRYTEPQVLKHLHLFLLYYSVLYHSVLYYIVLYTEPQVLKHLRASVL